MSILNSKVPNVTVIGACCHTRSTRTVFFMMQMFKNIFVVNALTMELPVKVENEYR